jgi:hypothetical protein
VEQKGCLGIEDVEGQIGEEHFGRPVEEGKVAPVRDHPAVVAELLVPPYLLPIQRELPFVNDGRESQPDRLLLRKRRVAAEGFRGCLEQDPLTASLESGTHEARVVEAKVEGDGPRRAAGCGRRRSQQSLRQSTVGEEAGWGRRLLPEPAPKFG